MLWFDLGCINAYESKPNQKFDIVFWLSFASSNVSNDHTISLDANNQLFSKNPALRRDGARL